MIRKIILPALLAFCLLTATSGMVLAADANEARLKAVFDKIMAEQREQAASRGDTLTFEGDTQIENAGSYYAVTLPHARLKTGTGNTLEIGMIAVNASPQSQPGNWKMTIAVPTPFTLKDAQGTPLTTLAIGGQKVTGIWNETIEYFTTLDASYSDIVVQDVAKTFSAKLAALDIDTSLTETKPGKWSGPLDMKLGKLEVLVPERQMKISLQSGGAHIDLREYDPRLITEKQKQIAAAAAPADGAAVGNMIFDLLTKSGEGFKTRYNVNGFELIMPQPGQEAMGRFALDKGEFYAAFTGFSSDNVTAHLGLDYQGLDPKPLSTHMRNVMPRQAHLNWELKNVPLQQLSATVQNTLGGFSAAGPEMSQLGMGALMFKLPMLLSQAKSALNVEKNFASNDLYRAELNGNVAADATAFTGFVSDFTLGMYGMDNLITALENAAAEPTTMYRTQIQSWASSLKYFKGFAVQQKDDQGTPVHRYHFQLTPQGQMLLNDKDAAALLSGSLLPPVPPAGSPSSGGGKTAVTPPTAAQ